MRRAVAAVPALGMVLSAALGLVLAPAAPAAAAALTGNPAANVAPSPDYPQVCYADGPATGACRSAEVAAIDAARAAEGVGPLVLPADYGSLTPAEQLFVVADLERVDRGLAPIAGLSDQLDAVAAQGAIGLTDPVLALSSLLSGSTVTAWGSNWAEGFDALDADYSWMYNDGWGGGGATFNVDCTSPTAAGCWGHRDNILGGYPGTVLSAGAATSQQAAVSPYDSLAEVFAGSQGTPPPYSYTWAQALAAGADAAPAPAMTGAAAVLNPDGSATITATGADLWPGTVTVTDGTGLPLALSVTAASAASLQVTVPYAGASGGAGLLSVSTAAGSAQAAFTWPGSPAPAPAAGPGAMVALAPYRVADTRTGSGQFAAGAPVPPHGVLVVPVGGTGGVPADADGVLLAVTAVSARTQGYLTVYPAGSAPPAASSLNLQPGQTTVNLAQSPLGTGGAVAVFNGSDRPAQVVLDVEGYLSPSATGAVTAAGPRRLADTRAGSGEPGAGSPVGPGSPLTVQVTGAGSPVPAGATAVLVTLTSVLPAGPGYLVAYPSGSTLPLASDLSLHPGQTVSSTALVPLGRAGSITVAGGGATGDVTVDLDGYTGAGAAVTPVAPIRVLDTRRTLSPLTPATSLVVPAAAVAAVVPATATAVLVNVTAVQPAGDGHLLAWSGQGSAPVASTVPYIPQSTSAVLSLVPLAPDGSFTLTGAGSTSMAVADVVGYVAS